MLEPSDVTRETILTALSAHFGLAATALEFTPRGEDSSAWAYRAETSDGRAYLLKLRRGPLNQAGLAIPHYLQEHGMRHVVAPLPTTAGALWATVDEFALMVYPFVTGHSAHEAGMTEAQWVEYGAAVRQIHVAAPPAELLEAVRRETFFPRSTQLIHDLDAHIGARSFSDALEQALVAVWRARRAQIHRLVDRSETLGLRLRATPLPAVLCHGDIHTANLLLEAQGEMWIVDWDEAMLAPKERDLMFAVGGIGKDWVTPKQTTLFLRGYGRTMVDPLALAYYRYDWAVQDVAAYAERVLLHPEMGTESKRSALRYFMVQFDPGGMVDIAESSRLP